MDITTSLLTDFSEPGAACHIGTGGTSFFLAIVVRRYVRKLAKVADQFGKSERYLNNIINSVGDPVFVKDDQSRVLIANDAFCALFATAREDVIGKTLAEDVDPKEREHFLRIDQQVIADGRESSVEETLTFRGSSTRTLLTRKTRYTDETGTHFLVGVIRDITQRKETENSLQLAASVFSHAREGIAITDAGGTIIDVNDMFTQISSVPTFFRGERVVEARNSRLNRLGVA